MHRLTIACCVDALETSPTVSSAISAILMSATLNLLSGLFSRLFVPVCMYLWQSMLTLCIFTPLQTYSTLSLLDKHRWNSGASRGVMGFLLASLGWKAFELGIPDDDIANGSSPFYAQAVAFALGLLLSV